MLKNNKHLLEQRFSKWLESNTLITKDQHLLLACSGGSDSVGLGLLLFINGFKFSLAYMNFGLREAALQEELFVQQLSVKWNTTAFIKRVSCQKYADQHKISIQKAARILRYSWFEELINQSQFDCLVTAHHLDDQIETILASLLRSSEFSVLYGIPEKRTNIARPLLNFCTKQELQNFLKLHNYTWCEDDSNFSDKYQRNFIRNHLVQNALSLNPGLYSFLQQKLKLYSQQLSFINESLRKLIPYYEIHEPDGFKTLDFKKLDTEESLITASLIQQWWLEKFNFTFKQIEEILALKEAHVGKKILLNQYEIWRERNGISVGNIQEINSSMNVYLQENNHIQIANRKIHIEIQKINNYFLRIWKDGDKVKLSSNALKPILISDFLTNKLIPSRQKKRCFVIENSIGEIIAIDELWKQKETNIVIKTEWIS